MKVSQTGVPLLHLGVQEFFTKNFSLGIRSPKSNVCIFWTILTNPLQLGTAMGCQGLPCFEATDHVGLFELLKANGRKTQISQMMSQPMGRPAAGCGGTSPTEAQQAL